MPLLNKKRFRRNPIPEGLKDTDKVFYCEVTNEIFDNYPDFAERIILCNSLVWSCEETGRSGLTFMEAMESEKNAKKLLSDFPLELRKPILFLVTLTARSALNDLTEDIFNYVRDRYFVGEIVDVNLIGDHWVACRVLQVNYPTQKELAEMKNGAKSHDKFKPPGWIFQYKVELVDKSDDDGIFHVNGVKLRRKKSTYTKERNHLFVKHFVFKVDGIWKLKSNAYKRYEIGKIKFENIFAGSPPKFSTNDSPKKQSKKSSQSTPVKSPTKNGSVNKVKKQESIDKYLKPKVEKDQKSPVKKRDNSGVKADKSSKVNGKKSVDKRKSTEEIIERELQEKRRKMMEHQQQIIERKQQKQLELQRKKDEKKKLEDFMKEWNKTREDLELEDLKELPVPVPIELDTPNEHFGQIAMLYEFFQVFSEQLAVKTFFPAGISLEILDRAVSKNEITGPLNDLLQLLLSAVFKLQEDEEDEIGEAYESTALTEYENLDSDKKDLSIVATNWPHAFQGVPLKQLTLDATTVTEVLRLHLLSSGCRVSEACTRWRNQEKGGFSSCDDPAVAFRTDHREIIETLSEKHIAALPVGDKILVLECLINQLSMFAVIRDVVHENVESNRLKKAELRTALAAEIRREKDLALQKKKKPAEKTDPAAKPEEDPAAAAAAPPPPPPAAPAAPELSKEKLEKLEKEIRDKKESLKRQLNELYMENMKVQLGPLGSDRAYRRFWIFPSIPGIFVEDDEQMLPPCLPRGTPSPNPALMKEKDTISYVKKLFQKEYNKENLGVISASSPKKTNGIRYSCILNDAFTSKDEPASKLPLTCWGDNENCPVHSTQVARTRWSYYRTENDLEQLLNSLNTRGKRESKLKAMLTQYKDMLVQNLSRPFASLNKSLKLEDSAVAEFRKSQRGNPIYDNTMLDFPQDSQVEEVLEKFLRNIIIDIEEKSNAGGLGCLRVIDRSKWIEAISKNGYEKSCYELIYGPVTKVETINENEDIGGIRIEIPRLPIKEKKYSNIGHFDIMNEYVKEVNPTIKDLSGAILQLGQSIELHYMKPPLGYFATSSEKTKSIENLEVMDIQKRWEVSLMSSTSYAQLFLHLCTLDNSIAWNKSALNANCRLCRRRGDPENMLLCDICNKGHHMYCLKPKLTKVPKGNWYCHYCKPPQKEPKAKKKHVYYAGESDDEFSDKRSPLVAEKMEVSSKGKCKTCGDKGMTIGCSKCLKRYHLACLVPPLRKPPTVTWSCNSCRHISARRDEAAMGVETVVVNGRRRRTRNSAEFNYSNQLPLDNASLQELLNKVMHHEAAWPFLRPVSRYEAADYFEIVKRPMDFATIKHKLNMLQYHTNSQVISDSMLVFSNCFLYNKETSDVYQAGVRLMTYLKKLCKEMNFRKEMKEAEIQVKRLGPEDPDDDDSNSDQDASGLEDEVEEEEVIVTLEEAEQEERDDIDNSSDSDGEEYNPKKKIRLDK
ncbi:bromodomain adjacent to zinc finger domain protein 1A-like isoform X2 [Planococcus citri]|uniref:bromodomain adjacent to zinc finger domain protein 1A-like isoform X2 n=1 Tax=Planococcus citri TaxID=170843 RepID=UPI0031F92042